MTSNSGERLSVRFDDVAWEEDTRQAKKSRSTAWKDAENARKRLEDSGVTLAELEECDSEGRDGTSLPGCYKLRLPPKERGSLKFRMVFALMTDGNLLFLAYGVGHQPNGIRARDAYQRAHARLWARENKP